MNLIVLLQRKVIMFRSLLVVLVALVVGSGCAARGPRDQARVGALTAIEAAVVVSQAESDVYAEKLYSKETHDTLVDAKLKVLYATRAYERAVRAWADAGTPAPAAIESARQAALVAIDDLQKVVPAIAAVRVPLDLALKALRDILLSTATGASLLRMTPMAAEVIPPSMIMILGILNVLTKLLSSGRTTWANILAFLKKEGVTDAELDAADLKVTAEILRVEAEQANR